MTRRWVAWGLVLAIIVLSGWFLLRAPDPAPVPASTPSVAVLPFRSTGTTTEDRDLAEGLGDEVVDALTRIERLTVASRAEAYRASVSGTDLATVARRLNVATLVTAQVAREGSRLRIEARLDRTGSDTPLWTNTYLSEADELPAAVQDIAVQVASALLGIAPAIAAPPPSVLEAPGRYAEFVRGRRALGDRGDADRVQLAMELFREVVAADAGFVRAQALLCQAEVARFELVRDAQALDRAGTHCTRARELDPALGDTRLAVAALAAARGEHEAATREYELAAADPARRIAAYVGLGRAWLDRGQPLEALAWFEKALALEPGNARLWFELGYLHAMTNDFRRAAETFRKALDAGPDRALEAMTLTTLGNCHLVLGELDPAANAFERALAIEASHFALNNLGKVRYYQGAYAAAADLFERAAALEPTDPRTRGNVGDALSAREATRAQARAHYAQAAELAREYLGGRSDKPDAVADLAWYEANLGDTEAARRDLPVIEAAAQQHADIALKAAMIHALLGDDERAQRFSELAIRLGYTDRLVHAEPVLARFGAPGPIREP
jgi:tetratricopeptide (TPR) repeat protein